MSEGRILSAFFADDIRHEANGKLLVVGLYQDVHLADREAASPDSLALYILFHGFAKGDYEIALDVRDIAGQKHIKQGIGTLSMAGERTIQRLLVRIEDFEFPTSGRYEFDILVDEKVLHTGHMRVLFPSDDEDEEDGDAEELEQAPEADERSST